MAVSHYLDITLRPDPEFSPAHLLNALYGKLHRALVRMGTGDIGVSFPQLAPQGQHLGRVLRLHGSLDALQRLQALPWLQGMYDHVQSGEAVPVPLHFLLKQEMERVPFVNWYARAMGMVFIPREDRRAASASLRRSADAVRAGATLCIFPEGTRSRDGRIGAFKPGAFEVAIQAGAQVLPLTSDAHSIAAVNADPTPGWRNENASVAESDPTFRTVPFTPRSSMSRMLCCDM